MAEMKEFVLWIFSELPDFLLSPPISAFVGMVLLFFAVMVLRALMRL